MFDQYKLTGDNVSKCFADDGKNFFVLKFAGQTNRGYLDAFQKLARDTGDATHITEEQAHEKLVNIFMDHVLHAWGSVGSDGVTVYNYFIDKNGEAVKHVEDQVRTLLLEAPLLFNVLHRHAQNRHNFTGMLTVEDVAGN